VHVSMCEAKKKGIKNNYEITADVGNKIVVVIYKAQTKKQQQ